MAPLFQQFHHEIGTPVTMKQLQHVVFEEIGKMAPQLMYVHVLQEEYCDNIFVKRSMPSVPRSHGD